MTWQSFQYAFLHAARDAGAAAITDNSHGWLTANPKDFLIDDRAGSLATFDSSESDHWIEVDRGTGTLEAIDRLIIPSGHNLAGATLTVTSGASSPPGTTRLTAAAVAAGMIDEAVTSNNDRYVRIAFTVTSGAWAIPQLIYTRTRTTTRGPEPGWVDMLRHNTLDFTKESGSVASLALGADRRYFELTYRLVVLAADLLVFSDLLSTCGTSKPFYIDEPFTGSDPIWVKLVEDSQQQLDRASPGSPDSARPEIRLAMLEHLA
jgi:hypothetical protein